MPHRRRRTHRKPLCARLPFPLNLIYCGRRAKRPSVLRPWRGECLCLRAADPRLYGRIVPIPAPTPPTPGSAPAAPPSVPVRAQQIRFGWRQLRAWCDWPTLPDPCSPSQVARILGVTRDTIARWCRSGKLLRRPAPARGSQPRWLVQYRPARETARLAARPPYNYPDGRFKRAYADHPDLAWAVDTFRHGRHCESLVRLACPRGIPGRRPGPLWLWLCPTCGRRCLELYLPAGPMARHGRHWRPWRFQCRVCTDFTSEPSSRRSDAFNRWLLRSSAGLIGRSEFRQFLHELATGRATEGLFPNLSPRERMARRAR